MDFVRNILLFTIAALIVGGCGGGNTTVASDNANSGTTTSTGTSNTTVSSNTTSSPSNTTNSNNSTGSNSGSGTPAPSVTLQWVAPTTLADNTTAVSLSDISGYRLYYGSSATYTPNVINITGGATTQYTVTLPSGSYYFRISAVDSSGHVGLMSSAIKKTF